LQKPTSSESPPETQRRPTFRETKEDNFGRGRKDCNFGRST
jgi:hypothetical protein